MGGTESRCANHPRKVDTVAVTAETAINRDLPSSKSISSNYSVEAAAAYVSLHAPDRTKLTGAATGNAEK